MASEINVDDENVPACKKQVFCSASGTYWRVNPDDDCEIQRANSPDGEWKSFQRFTAPIIELASDDEHKCAAVTIKQYRKIYLHLGSI